MYVRACVLLFLLQCTLNSVHSRPIVRPAKEDSTAVATYETVTAAQQEVVARPVSRRLVTPVAYLGAHTKKKKSGNGGAAADGAGRKMVYMPRYVIPDGSPVDPCVTCHPRRWTLCKKRTRPCEDASSTRCSCRPGKLGVSKRVRTAASSTAAAKAQRNTRTAATTRRKP